MRTLIFFSTHKINEAILSEYKKWQNIEGYDVILNLDNTNQKFSSDTDNPIQYLEFYGKKYKCFLFDENVHKSLNLPNYVCYKDKSFSGVQWSNGDYRFYYVRKYFPNYDYYWQTEYDIFCNGQSYKPFLDSFIENKSDLIIQEKFPHSHEPIEEWFWYDKTDWVYKDLIKYRSFFPIVRLSAAAIDFLFKRRMEHGELYSKIEDKTLNRWIHCELFTPTELINNGFSCHYINEYLFINPEIDLNANRLFEHPDNRLYHPVKGSYVERLDNLKAEIKEYKRENKKLKQLVKELSYYKINILGIKINIKRKF